MFQFGDKKQIVQALESARFVFLIPLSVSYDVEIEKLSLGQALYFTIYDINMQCLRFFW